MFVRLLCKQHSERFLNLFVKTYIPQLNEQAHVYISQSGCQWCCWEYGKQADIRTHEPVWKRQTPCKKESRWRHGQDTSALNTQEHFHCPALSSSPWLPWKTHRAAISNFLFYGSDVRFKKVIIGASNRGKAKAATTMEKLKQFHLHL